MSFLIHTFCHGTCKLSLLHCGVVFFSSFRVPLKQLHILAAHFPKWATALPQRERYKSIIANRFYEFNIQFRLFSVIFVNFLLIFLIVRKLPFEYLFISSPPEYLLYFSFHLSPGLLQ